MPRKTFRTVPAEAPELIPSKRVLCKIQGVPRGGNIFEATTGEESYLVQLPNRFRKSLWIKPGSFVIVDLVDESSKVRGEIVHVLLPDEVKERRRSASWPQGFDSSSPGAEKIQGTVDESIVADPPLKGMEVTDGAQKSEDEENIDEDADLWQNTNRR